MHTYTLVHCMEMRRYEHPARLYNSLCSDDNASTTGNIGVGKPCADMSAAVRHVAEAT